MLVSAVTERIRARSSCLDERLVKVTHGRSVTVTVYKQNVDNYITLNVEVTEKYQALYEDTVKGYKLEIGVERQK